MTAATGSIRAVVTAIAAPTLGTCPTGRGWRSCTASTGIATRRLKLSSETSTMRRHGVALGCIARRVDGPRQWQAAFWERDPKSVQRHIICRRLDSPDGRNEDGGGGGGGGAPTRAPTRLPSATRSLYPREECKGRSDEEPSAAMQDGCCRCCWNCALRPRLLAPLRRAHCRPLYSALTHAAPFDYCVPRRNVARSSSSRARVRVPL